MSRLDDELRKAFRREQPSVDFTARLLQRVAQQPAPKASWHRRLALLLNPPTLRWVAIGVTASLLLAIGAAQYGRMHQVVVNDDGKLAKSAAAPEPGGPGSVAPNTDHPQQGAGTAPAKPLQQIKRPAPSSSNHRLRQGLAQAGRKEAPELRTEGEAAKEKLLLALSIASSALNDAQKAVHDNGLKP